MHGNHATSEGRARRCRASRPADRGRIRLRHRAPPTRGWSRRDRGGVRVRHASQALQRRRLDLVRRPVSRAARTASTTPSTSLGRGMLAEQRESWTAFANTMNGLLAPPQRHRVVRRIGESMTPTLAPEVAAFAAAVRAELSDLPPSELDDLVDGLEADLAERADESPGDALGDPSSTPPSFVRRPGISTGRVPAHGGQGRGAHPSRRTHILRGACEQLACVRRAAPGLAGRGSFLVALRPLWWVFRGWVGYFIVSRLWTGRGVLGDYLFEWIVLALAVVLSVQYGRGRWFTRPSLRPCSWS